MTQKERRIYLINELLNEQKEYGGQWYENPDIPADEQAQKRLLRSLFNIRSQENSWRSRMRICRKRPGRKGSRTSRNLPRRKTGFICGRGILRR